FLAGVGCWQPGRGLRRLAVVLGGPEARISRRAYVAAVAAPRTDPARRGLHEEMGHSRNLYRAVFWTVARGGAADCRNFRNAVLAFPAGEFLVGLRVGGGVAHHRRCRRRRRKMAMGMR